jgi:hypothetical protein
VTGYLNVTNHFLKAALAVIVFQDRAEASEGDGVQFLRRQVPY